MDNQLDQDKELLTKICRDQNVDVSLIEQLIEFETSKVHLQRRRGAKDAIQKMIEDWLEEQEG